VESESEKELVNLKERLSKIHSVDIEAVEKRYSDLVATLKTDKEELEKVIREKDKQIEGEHREMERVRLELIDRIKEREARILQLQERLKESGDVNANEMRNLHTSFHNIETEKELMTDEYQTNVGFLNQQIAKLSSNTELKNAEIKKLQEEIVELKAQYSESIKDMDQRWKQERNDREQELETGRKRREEREEEFRVKEREWKLSERQLEREKEKLER
jgi:uncharacterized phage infection (PIP) family protein YhgE